MSKKRGRQTRRRKNRRKSGRKKNKKKARRGKKVSEENGTIIKPERIPIRGDKCNESNYSHGRERNVIRKKENCESSHF